MAKAKHYLTLHEDMASWREIAKLHRWQVQTEGHKIGKGYSRATEGLDHVSLFVTALDCVFWGFLTEADRALFCQRSGTTLPDVREQAL